MKIIFLDVDGVLNHSECREWTDTAEVLDPEIVERVKDICAKTGAKIVISSVWRLGDSFNLLKKTFGNLIVGRTPDLVLGRLSSPAHGRWMEICRWLLVNRLGGAHIEEIVVIDDDKDAEVADIPFVQTNFCEGGLTKALGDKVLEALGHVPLEG